MSSRASNEPSVLSATADTTTPATRPTTTSIKRKSDDMAWEWGECRDPNNKNFVWCTLCDKRMSGGINRLKEHLVHKKGNVTSCPKVTIEIQQKVNATLLEVKKKKLDKARIHDLLQRQDEDDDVEEEDICGGGGKKNQCISIGCAMRRNAIDNVRGPLDQLLTTENTKQSTLDKNNPHKQALKKQAWLCIAKWAYEVGLPFNAVRPPSFTKMIHAIGEYGRAMPPPSYHNLRVTLLKEVYAETKEFVNSFRPHWQLYGCSLMSDFWTDGKGRCLINFMVGCPKGTIFLKSIDASEEVKAALYIVRMIKEVIVEVGAENIVSFVTDNGSNYKLAGSMLEEEYGSMFWTPCAAHCINLMLHDFGSGERTALPKIKSALSEAKVVVVFLYNHGRVLAWLRKLTGDRELHRSCVTRFATQFYTLRSMWENRHHVQVLFVSEYWRKSDFAKKLDGKRAEKIVAKESFWDNVYFSCQVMAPLVDVLRMVDREEKPCMGYLYEAMKRAEGQIEKNLGLDKRTWTKVKTIIDNRWEYQLHRPLHAAGFYLNPSIYFKETKAQMETNSVVKAGLFKAMAVLIPESESDDAMDQLKLYRDAEGTFGIKSAISRRETMQPHEWWLQYGSDAPSLAKFAVKVLAQTCSASPCERNWSAFDNLHSKKRNCLLQSKLNDLVYIQYNRMLEKRFKERLADSDSDPILLKEIDENDDWVIPSETQLEDFVMEGDDLTWEQVRAARGADDIDVGPSTRSRTRNQVTIRDEADEDDEVDLEGRSGAGEHGEGSRDDNVNESVDGDDIDIEAGDDQ